MSKARLSILYQDEHMVAIHKPSGWLVHRNAKGGDAPIVLQRLRDKLCQHVYPVHRLDAGTSGVLVMGLTQAGARGLGSQFENRQTDKTYLAMVRGWPEAYVDMQRPLYSERAEDDQPARSQIWRLARSQRAWPVSRWPSARFSLLLMRPHTGRFHQLRRHCNHLSHPIINDVNHGDRRYNRLLRQNFDCYRLLLHAWQLRIHHPISGKPMLLEAVPDAEWCRAAQLLGLPAAWPRRELLPDQALQADSD